MRFLLGHGASQLLNGADHVTSWTDQAPEAVPVEAGLQLTFIGHGHSGRGRDPEGPSQIIKEGGDGWGDGSRVGGGAV
jgi:hypothetical protein